MMSRTTYTLLVALLLCLLPILGAGHALGDRETVVCELQLD